MKVAILTLGCKLNQYESEMVKEMHLKRGDTIVSLKDAPDLVYINTCSVTAMAGHESRNLFHRALSTGAEVKVMGCHAKLFPEEFENAAFFDPDTIKGINIYQERMRAYVRIQKGCENFCTYCIVPYARGENRSFPPEQIIKEVKEKTRAGFFEIILTGTHIGNYNYKGVKLPDLIKMLLDENIQVRLSSLKPDNINDELIELFEHERLAPHIHISQQSGDNRILKWMGRNYTGEDTIRIVSELRGIRPEINIGADFIVGFPGEDEEAFQNSVRLVEEAFITYLHVFRYSPRPFTLATLLPNQVHDSVRKMRSKILRKLGTKNNFEYRKTMVGKVFRVIPSRKMDYEDRLYYGFTPNYIRVLFSKEPVQNPVDVKITHITEERTYGERV